VLSAGSSKKQASLPEGWLQDLLTASHDVLKNLESDVQWLMQAQEVHLNQRNHVQAHFLQCLAAAASQTLQQTGMFTFPTSCLFCG
jgi:hypothetical protein